MALLRGAGKAGDVTSFFLVSSPGKNVEKPRENGEFTNQNDDVADVTYRRRGKTKQHRGVL